MKSLLILIFVTGFTHPSWGRTTYETGRGNEMGYCSYNQGYFCIDDIKRRAETNGKRDAEWSCQLQRGTPRSYSANCNTSCFPNYLSPNDQNTMVRCNSSCTMSCEIQD